MKLLTFLELESTNDYLKINADKLDNFTVVQCFKQTNGRGRNGHFWDDFPGSNLTLSWLIKDPYDPISLSLCTAYAILQTLQKIGISGQIKWPNDILVGGNKIAGILTETSYKSGLEAIIIGLGINCNSNGHYYSLEQELGRAIDINELRDILLQKFTEAIELKHSVIVTELNNKSYLKDKWIKHPILGQVRFQELALDNKIRIERKDGSIIKAVVNEISLRDN